MAHETLEQIETRIRQAGGLAPDRKAELLRLLSRLRAEIEPLSRTDADQARSIAAFTEISTHEATRVEQRPRQLSLSLAGLASSVEGFEQSHPRLVQVVNTISTMLANSGV
ncbi:MAG: DUF4404 family protein [Verrucomicrobia bacterium]|nr:DUF4404 family protein [Verrucomicrobiota bacterium]